MQLVVEATGVADRLSLVVPPPQGGGGRAAVGAAKAETAGRGLEHGTLHTDVTNSYNIISG